MTQRVLSCRIPKLQLSFERGTFARLRLLSVFRALHVDHVEKRGKAES